METFCEIERVSLDESDCFGLILSTRKVTNMDEVLFRLRNKHTFDLRTL